MNVGGFEMSTGELDGCKLIETAAPRVVDLKQLAYSASSHYGLWEDGVPTVTLNDVSMQVEVSGMARMVLVFLLKRNQNRPEFWGAACVYGDNEPAAEWMREVLLEVGRPLDALFRTREEAFDYLRGCIARARAREQDVAREREQDVARAG